MSRQLRASAISLAVHALLAGTLFALWRMPPAPVRIDLCNLQLLKGPAPASPPLPERVETRMAEPKKAPVAIRPANPEPGPPKQRKPEKELKMAAPFPDEVKPTAPAEVPPPAPPEVSREEVVAPSPSAAPPENHPAASSSPAGDLPGPEAPFLAAAEGESQTPRVTPEISRADYLAVHFSGIRDRIDDYLVYPAIARRRGWSGQVKVSFLILRDGSIDQVRVVASSGFGVLDDTAVLTVKNAAPFPPPPVVAEIVMPITYRLN